MNNDSKYSLLALIARPRWYVFLIICAAFSYPYSRSWLISVAIWMVAAGLIVADRYFKPLVHYFWWFLPIVIIFYLTTVIAPALLLGFANSNFGEFLAFCFIGIGLVANISLFIYIMREKTFTKMGWEKVG